MSKERWEKSGDPCPKCGKPSEVLIKELQFDGDEEPKEYVIAERCNTCGWQDDFLSEK